MSPGKSPCPDNAYQGGLVKKFRVSFIMFCAIAAFEFICAFSAILVAAQQKPVF